MDTTSLLVADKNPVNEEEMNEAFAREQTKWQSECGPLSSRLTVRSCSLQVRSEGGSQCEDVD